MEHVLQLNESDRQTVLLALAELALSRPGWDDMLREIAMRFERPSGPLYERLKAANADRICAQRSPLGPLIAEQDTEEIQRWIWGVENGQPTAAGDFLRTVVAAALRADHENYPLLRPTIVALKQKFPKYRFEGKLAG